MNSDPASDFFLSFPLPDEGTDSSDDDTKVGWGLDINVSDGRCPFPYPAPTHTATINRERLGATSCFESLSHSRSLSTSTTTTTISATTTTTSVSTVSSASPVDALFSFTNTNIPTSTVLHRACLTSLNPLLILKKDPPPPKFSPHPIQFYSWNEYSSPACLNSSSICDVDTSSDDEGLVEQLKENLTLIRPIPSTVPSKGFIESDMEDSNGESSEIEECLQSPDPPDIQEISEDTVADMGSEITLIPAPPTQSSICIIPSQEEHGPTESVPNDQTTSPPMLASQIFEPAEISANQNTELVEQTKLPTPRVASSSEPHDKSVSIPELASSICTAPRARTKRAIPNRTRILIPASYEVYPPKFRRPGCTLLTSSSTKMKVRFTFSNRFSYYESVISRVTETDRVGSSPLKFTDLSMVHYKPLSILKKDSSFSLNKESTNPKSNYPKRLERMVVPSDKALFSKCRLVQSAKLDRYYSRINIYELSKILKLDKFDISLTREIEVNILEIFKNCTSFNLGYQTWVRDTVPHQRVELLDRLFKYTSRVYPEFDRFMIEVIIKRGTYSLMQSRLRRTRRFKGKQEIEALAQMT